MSTDERPLSASDLEQLARLVEASDDYRVLRRLRCDRPRPASHVARSPATRVGLFLDLETTGLNAFVDEVIEVGAVRFAYSLDGEILGVEEPFARLRQPSLPIPAQVTALTGIDESMVAGKRIEPEELDVLLADVAIVISHNSGFDRPFAERLHPAFAALPWACSMSQIRWHEHGFQGTKLAYLAADAGFFYSAHRAANDCLAALELLARPLGDDATALAHLLGAARKPTFRVFAEGSPFETKDLLRSRGYRWSNGGNGQRRCWFIDLEEEDQIAHEIEFLRTSILPFESEPPVTRLTALERFSGRAGALVAHGPLPPVLRSLPP